MASLVHEAVYSGIPVYEQIANSVAVMRRQSDSFLNATQILKVADIPKTKRLKIIEVELLSGVHEKVQGGYGKYQGTWIPFDKGVELAVRYGVYNLIKDVIEYNPAEHGAIPSRNGSKAHRVLTSSQIKAATATTARRTKVTKSKRTASTRKRAAPGPGAVPASSPVAKRYRYPTQSSIPGSDLGPMGYSEGLMSMAPSSPGSSPVMRFRPSLQSSPVPVAFGGASMPSIPPFTLGYSQPGSMSASHAGLSSHGIMLHGSGLPDTPLALATLPSDSGLGDIALTSQVPTGPSSDLATATPLDDSETATLSPMERQRGLLMALFLSDDLPNFTDCPELAAQAPEIDYDLVIDDQGHTPLHWAAALARNTLLQWLLDHGADCLKLNYSGESALMRAVLSTNHYDRHSFPEALVLLHDTIPLTDTKSRSVVHHIVLMANHQDKLVCAQYYLECLLEWVVRTSNATNNAITAGAPSSPPHSTERTAQPDADFVHFMNLTDCHGDTALNIAARIGNPTLVRLLMSAGASPNIANADGLKPTDFGVVTEVTQRLAQGLPGDDDMLDRSLVTSRDTAASAPLHGNRPATAKGKSQMVVALVQQAVDELERDFQQDVQTKQQEIDDLKCQLSGATADLKEARCTVDALRDQLTERDALQRQISTLEQILASSSNVPEVPSDPLLADTSSLSPQEMAAHMTKLNSYVEAHQLMNNLLRQHIDDIQSQATQREIQCKRVLSLCCNIPLDQVDALASHLLAAMESEGTRPTSGSNDQPISISSTSDHGASTSLLNRDLSSLHNSIALIQRSPAACSALAATTTTAPSPGRKSRRASSLTGLRSGVSFDVNSLLSTDMSEEQNIQKITEFMNAIRHDKKSALSTSTNPPPALSAL
ncbi:transcriptional regulator swi6 [Dimargaris verticillata]|uniref:Transcriptional regulator swi6 n=1 Tax=Dimargaris verticillata TaxID=2761393 RepID=A0A9W8EAT8_9FUNG|nr:transcriptional regulator swi6 [Dimargaris verticillata]